MEHDPNGKFGGAGNTSVNPVRMTVDTDQTGNFYFERVNTQGAESSHHAQQDSMHFTSRQGLETMIKNDFDIVSYPLILTCLFAERPSAPGTDGVGDAGPHR